MTIRLPHTASGHLLALTGMITLHAGLAAWAMQPTPPVAIPQQQVIRVTMVAPATAKAQPVQPVPMKQEAPKIPPKEKGRVKVERKPQPVKPVPVKEVKQPEILESHPETKRTSGLQSEQAIETQAAITEPVAAAYLNNPTPEYPPVARKRKQQGTVMIEVGVDRSGQPKNVALAKSSGYDLLDESALDAVRRWKFVPARRGSEHIEATVVVPVEFRIN